MNRCAFQATADYRAKHTDLLEFVNPAAAALWNMRWQIRGYVAAVPDASESDLFGRFAAGSGLRAGNMRTIFGDSTWEEQLSRFGEMLLASAIATYEGWAHELINSLGLSKSDAGSLDSYLTGASVSEPERVRAVATIGASTSAFARTEFQPGLRAGNHALGANGLTSLLTAFRAYKAVRNAQTHRSGIASDQQATTILAASALTASDVGTRARPVFPDVVAGERIGVTYPLAVGCTAVLLKLVMTVDAELAGTIACEQDVRRRIEAIPNLNRWRELPASPDARHRRLRFLLGLSGAPEVTDADHAIEWLKESRILLF
jgi:hypothetical protein